MDRRFQIFLGNTTYPTESLAGNGTISNSTFSYANTPWADPTYLSVVSNGEIGELRFTVAQHPEDALGNITLYTPIQIKDFIDSDVSTESSEDSSDGVVVFDGVVVKSHVKWGGTEEHTEFVCYNNADFLLDRIVLHGQTRFDHTNEQDYYDDGPESGAYGIASTDVISVDTPLIFNPDGAPNALNLDVFFNDTGDDSSTFRLFDNPYRNQTNIDGTNLLAVPWKLSWAVGYLLNVYKLSWAIDPTSIQDGPLSLFATFGDPVVSNINLEGKSLLEGLKLLLEPHNYIFWTEPMPSDSTTNGQQHNLKFAFRGDTTYSATVRLSPRGTDAGNTTYDSNLIDADIVIDSTCVVNTIKSFGAQIEFTTLCHSNSTTAGVLKLVKDWDDDDLTWALNGDGTVNPYDTTFRKNYCHPDLISQDITNTPYGVGRMWVVNLGEAPAYDLEDLGTKLKNGIFTNRNSITPRRLERPNIFTTNSAGGLFQQEDVQVELSFDSGTSWDIVDKSEYRILSESIGIVFVNPKLERLGLHFLNTTGTRNYWEALHSGKLQIRILAAVKSDERVQAIRSNVGDSIPLAIERVYSNEAYRKFIFNSGISGSVYYTQFAPFEPTQDDSTLLTDITNQQAARSDRLMVTGQLTVLLGEWGEYHPGQVITEITNRYTFSPPPTVLRTIYDFTNKHVQLVLDSRTVKSIIGARRIDDANRQEARIGQGMHQITGGTKVPYLPGVDSSFRQSIIDGPEAP